MTRRRRRTAARGGAWDAAASQGRARSRRAAPVVGGIDLDEVPPLGGDLVLRGDRVYGTRLHAGIAVDALLGVDVELLDLVVFGLVRCGGCSPPGTPRRTSCP